MRSFFSLLFLVALLVGGAYFIYVNNGGFEEEMEGAAEIGVLADISKSQLNEVNVASETNQLQETTGELFDFINGNSSEVVSEFGQPLRKDLSAYGYTWWVYTDHQHEYVLFGMEGDIVKTIYATGEEVASGPFSIGITYAELEQQFSILDKVDYFKGDERYSFILNEQQKERLPLIKLSDDLFVICYFDIFTKKLSSIRIATGDLLLEQRFYELEYRGELPKERSKDQDTWTEIEKGMERQVLDISNMYRQRHGLQPLIRDPEVREVAYLHSKDMAENSYFSHERQDGTGLKERLEEKEIVYSAAGENIAAQYSDAPAAVEGWLNSEGHREALLYSGYSHLGTGVYELYYTQNFIKKK